MNFRSIDQLKRQRYFSLFLSSIPEKAAHICQPRDEDPCFIVRDISIHIDTGVFIHFVGAALPASSGKYDRRSDSRQRRCIQLA